MRSILVYLLLTTVKWLSRFFWRFRGEWIGIPPDGDWSKVKLLVILNHTSLYEPILAGYAPDALLWRFARHGVLPVAEKTMRRRIGLFFNFLARHVVEVTRQRDHTWENIDVPHLHKVQGIGPEGWSRAIKDLVRIEDSGHAR